MFEHLAAIVAGYVFAILVGYWAIGALMRSAWSSVTARLGTPYPSGPNPHPEHSAAVGLLERAPYTGAWQLGAKEFLGIWLVLKVLGNWKGWGEDVHGRPSLTAHHGATEFTEAARRCRHATPPRSFR